MTGDFDRLFGKLPWGCRRNEDGTTGANHVAWITAKLAMTIFEEMKAMRAIGLGDREIATTIAAAFVRDMEKQKHGR